MTQDQPFSATPRAAAAQPNDSTKAGAPPAGKPAETPDLRPGGDQNKPSPVSPRDGQDNQGGIRREGETYHRELGNEQDA